MKIQQPINSCNKSGDYLYLSISRAINLIQAIIISCLDDCNSFFSHMFFPPPTCSQVVARVTFSSDYGSHHTHLWFSIVSQISLHCGKVLGDPTLSDLCFPCHLYTDHYCSHCFCRSHISVPVYTVFFPPLKLGCQLRNHFLREDC